MVSKYLPKHLINCKENKTVIAARNVGKAPSNPVIKVMAPMQGEGPDSWVSPHKPSPITGNSQQPKLRGVLQKKLTSILPKGECRAEDQTHSVTLSPSFETLGGV